MLVQYKPRTCTKCGHEYLPASSTQQYCPACSPWIQWQQRRRKAGARAGEIASQPRWAYKVGDFISVMMQEGSSDPVRYKGVIKAVYPKFLLLDHGPGKYRATVPYWKWHCGLAKIVLEKGGKENVADMRQKRIG